MSLPFPDNLALKLVTYVHGKVRDVKRCQSSYNVLRFCFLEIHSDNHFVAIGRFSAKSSKNDHAVCEPLHCSGLSFSFQEGTKTFSEL